MSMHIREKENNVDVYFTISNGQFVCNEYMGTDEIVMRFGNEEKHVNQQQEIVIIYLFDIPKMLNKLSINAK